MLNGLRPFLVYVYDINNTSNQDALLMENVDTPLANPVTERDHLRGPASASLELVQYGDYACPYCTEVYPIIEHLLNERAEEIRFAYRHFPTASPSRSRKAAEAAEAAGAQGAFWEMHERLSRESGATLDEERLTELAEDLDLDLDRFRSEMEKHVHYDRLEEDMESARAGDVRGTPTFFINGKRYDGALSKEALTDML